VPAKNTGKTALKKLGAQIRREGDTMSYRESLGPYETYVLITEEGSQLICRQRKEKRETQIYKRKRNKTNRTL